MLTQEEKNLMVLKQVPFVSVSQNKIADSLKGEISDNDLYLTLSSLVAEQKIQMVMGPKGPEYSRKWNSQIDEERKSLTKELNKRFDEKTIFYPRYEGYVANVEDNFFNGNYHELLAAFGELNSEYVKWHRNSKSGVVYPPKMQALNSSSVVSCNLLQGMDLDPNQVEYAVEFEVIAAEAMKDRPEEISAPKVQFDAIVNYEDSVEFVQTNFLEHFYQPFRQSMWAYQYGSRYLFEDEKAIELWRAFVKKSNYVFFDGNAAIKTMIAIYSDILANPEDYKGKNVRVLNVNWNMNPNSTYTALASFQEEYLKEGKKSEEELNELLALLPLPEGTKLEYQFLTLEEVASNLPEDAKNYIEKRYLNF